ncbi:MAG TPA: SPFH domain-containing protein [Syntrophorhabdaceae bacterium]|nr:SPFH domain-containing protein [Syntrophorhabdaceae bacterium]
MGVNNKIFMEVIEWFDDTGKEIAHRIPGEGSGEIKYGAQLTVRESQAAVFFYEGKAYDAVGAGRYTLSTLNIPVITKILSLPWGFTSPLRAEVYFVNMKTFPNLAWGTRDPVAFKDAELGLIRLRAFGVFNIRVAQPTLFINSIVGTQNVYTVSDIEDYLGKVIVSRFNDYLGEKLDTVFNLPGQYEAISEGLIKTLEQDFARFGIMLSNLYIDSITPPPEVQKAIDDKSKLGIFDDLNKLLKMKAAMAVEEAAQNPAQAGAGLGMGLGFMMPAMYSEMAKNDPQSKASLKCPDCKNDITADAKFCPSCGHQLLIYQQCASCGKNVPPHARYCPFCGQATTDKQSAAVCPHCKTENIPGATYCNQCGEKI